MKPIPYNTVKLSNENQQFQGYPVNYNNDYNYQVPMGQPMRNPQQYPYADHEMINPQMQNPQQYPYLDHNMINPEINNQPQIIVIGLKSQTFFAL